MKAILKNYRQSPRKVRLIADLIRGKKVDDAMVQLSFVSKRASSALIKLLQSAVANAAQNNGVSRGLVVSSIEVNEAPVIKRWRARARGRAAQILKRSSHVTLVLGVAGSDTVAPKEKSTPVAKKETPEPEKVSAPKKTTSKKTTKKVTKES
jgi:large subunit ribosomal protein L22